MSGRNESEQENVEGEDSQKLEKPLSNSPLLEYEIQVAKQLITRVEEYETELKPAFDLVYYHRKRLCEGGWTPPYTKVTPTQLPTFFPTKKFNDGLKSNFTSQKELKQRLIAIENNASLLFTSVEENKIKNREQDRKLDQLTDLLLNNKAFLGKMKNEMEKYDGLVEGLSEKINERKEKAKSASGKN